MIDFARGGHELFQQAQALPRGVVAVVAPALHQDFDFGIGVGPPAFLLVRLNHLHLRKRGVPGAFARERGELVITKALQ